MNNPPDQIQIEIWVVHIDVRIGGTIVWEGIVTGFKDKQEAKSWQKQFMACAPRQCSTALMLTDNAPHPQEIAQYLRKEIARFMTELKEE